MKTLIITILSFILTSYLFGQKFSKDYFEYCKPAWEKQPSEDEKKSVNPFADSLVFAMTGRHIGEINVQEEKEKTLNKILHYKNVMQLKGFEIDTLSNFIVIEESNLVEDWTKLTMKCGIVVLKDMYFSYSYDLADPSSLMLTNNFLENYDAINKNDPRSILFHLAIQNKADQISALAVKEMNSTNLSEYQLKKQYEILIYNQKSEQKVRLSYIHELLTDIYEQ